MQQPDDVLHEAESTAAGGCNGEAAATRGNIVVKLTVL